MSAAAPYGSTPPRNGPLREWVDAVVAQCTPAEVFWCDGTEAEMIHLLARAQQEKVIEALNPEKLPRCFLHRSHPNDVARVEQLTFICTPTADEAGPTNNWADPGEMSQKLARWLHGAMQGRTLYVVPYLMGPLGSPLAKVGVELTDSLYVVLNMRIMCRMGHIALEHLGDSSDFNRGLHSVLDLNPQRRAICHFPQDNAVTSVGSGYGGNALLGKKCFALRVGSYLGHTQGWMAEHMLLMCVESPAHEKFYVAAAFPSACGKTNFAMLIPPAGFDGWKITTVGDDIAWMHPRPDGRLWAINPEAGYFGVAPGTNFESNPNAMRTIAHDTIYTNVAVTQDGDVWWEGKDGEPPAHAMDWKGRPWTPASKEKAAHPNSRFTAPMTNNPALAAEADDPQGVPISAIVFGGRRATTMPLIFQAFDWKHGVYLGATMGSEMTAAAAGTLGEVRRDPMAMLPFCGYHMGDYFQHWLDIGAQLQKPPAIFHVNWFRKDAQGAYLWPGFGENMRVLKWMIDRVSGRLSAIETPIGRMPRSEDFEWHGLDLSREKFDELQRIDPQEWTRELTSQDRLFERLGERLPAELRKQRASLAARLAADPAAIARSRP
jgi:phosphoenolpyruvate carboxykinase (GTP)